MIRDPGLMTILACFAFSLGACIASFLNVVIWRVPRGESIVSPPSHCPKCNAAIKWYQNIPILSWLALRGKCASCKAQISPRYILIEALGGILFLAVFFRYGVSISTLFMWIWVALMIVGAMIDFDHQLLPDFVTVGGMILGLVFNGLNSALFRSWFCIVYSLCGLIAGFGLLWLIRYFGSKVFGREAMGLGDVFLMGAVGALFGPAAVLMSLVLSSVFGSLVGLSMIACSKLKLGRFVEIPYGPHICLGCLAWMFFGEEILVWYMNLMKGV